MGIREEVLELEKEVKEIQEVQEQSFASQILSDYKKDKKRLFIIWIITFLALISVTCYLVYTLNDIGTETTTTTIEQENADGYNNYIGNDGVDSKGTYYSYGVVTYISFDIPIIGAFLKIPIYTESNRIFKF